MPEDVATTEGRMIPKEEARVRAKIRKVKELDAPKTRISFKRTIGHGDSRYYDTDINTGTIREGRTKGNAVYGEAHYLPKDKRMEVHVLYPMQYKGNPVAGEGKRLTKLHEEVGGHMLPRPNVVQSLERTAKAFPKVDLLYGSRITGAKAGKGIMQKFPLDKIRSRLGRLGKAGQVLGVGLAAYDLVRKFQQE